MYQLANESWSNERIAEANRELREEFDMKSDRVVEDLDPYVSHVLTEQRLERLCSVSRDL